MKVSASAARDLSRSVSPLQKTNHVFAPLFSKYKNNNSNSMRKNPLIPPPF